MRRVAIVGVEGSGKTVMLAGLGELYSRPDEYGYYLAPKNFETANYVSDKIERMRRGEWPSATAGDALQGLDWTLKRKVDERRRPQDICEVSFLDFAGEVYRVAFGVNKNAELDDEAAALKRYIREASDVIVLINLSDVISCGLANMRVREAMWITNEILTFALDEKTGRKMPRAAIVLSQADSYADTITSCGGVIGILKKYLPHVANDYGWLDLLEARAVDRTDIDGEGNTIPAKDFKTFGLKPIMDWILKAQSVEDETSIALYSIDQTKCKGCTMCARTCPVGAIEGSVREPHAIDPKKCNNCGECKLACKFGAICSTVRNRVRTATAAEGGAAGNRDVYLMDGGDNQIAVIKAVREATGAGLKEAKELVDATPVRASRIVGNVPFEKAVKIASELENAGATIRLALVGRVPKPEKSLNQCKAERRPSATVPKPQPTNGHDAADADDVPASAKEDGSILSGVGVFIGTVALFSVVALAFYWAYCNDGFFSGIGKWTVYALAWIATASIFFAWGGDAKPGMRTRYWLMTMGGVDVAAGVITPIFVYGISAVATCVIGAIIVLGLLFAIGASKS